MSEDAADSQHPIPLDSSFLRLHGRERTEAELRRIVCSVKFELLEKQNVVRLLGPEMSYHQADPYLQKRLEAMGLSPGEILSYTVKTERVDFCFEDSWTGYFVAQMFEERRPGDSLSIIHLDDHSDMMATLLCVSDAGLVDPTSGSLFDPRNSGCWRTAIYSGAVNIGNYMTPLYYSGTQVNICHVNNDFEHNAFRWILPETSQYDLIPEKQFATIAKLDSASLSAVGTYCVASRPEEVLRKRPSDWTVVHIDLDYFINDFNGASRGAAYTPNPALRDDARRKLNHFFDVLADAEIEVERWIIATSPGFCSAHHWEWLLMEIKQRIQAYERRPL